MVVRIRCDDTYIGGFGPCIRAYTLDNAGNRTGVTETQLLPNGTTDTRTVVYRYDNLYRLLSETISGDSQGGNGTISYTYDLAGNRMSRTSNVAGVSTVIDTYNANDELTSEVSGGVTTTYQYDSNGNMIETSNGTTTTTFTYDSQNRLIKQNAGQPNEVDIVYDGAGSKVAETVNGVTTKYLIDTNNPTGYSQIVEEIVNGAVTRRYTLGRWIISETQNISGTWTTSFYGYDGHSSVRFLTNSTGAVTDNYTFDAFGTKISGTGTTPNQILYSGEYLDPGTGNYDLRNRVYQENTGTFLTRDTYAGQNGDPITLHQYLYADANPVMMTDPSGNISMASLSLSISIGLTLAGGSEYLAGGSAVQVLRQAIFGGETGAIIGLAVATDRVPEIVWAGLLGGAANFVVSAFGDSIRDAQGKSPIGGPPSKAKYLDAFLLGFEVAANQEFFAPESIIRSAGATAGIALLSDIAGNLLVGQPVDWKQAITDTVVTGAIGLILNPLTSPLFANNAALAAEVGTAFGQIGGPALTAEIGLLIQAWLP